MARSIEVSAKTRELAIEKGLAELSLTRDEVTVEVLENEKHGFLGIGAVKARILMTVLSDEPEMKEEKKAEKKPVFDKAPKQTKKEEYVAPKDAVPATGDAAEFLTKVIGFICDGATVCTVPGAEEGTESLEIVGPNLGGVIGRRGETLDALQHLANLVVNRRNDGKTRIMLDAENYRAKRSESLEKFAQRAASQVIKYKRNKALEPMNAYERHIVHVALQDMENISTSSVGVEPNRRIVINYTGPDARPYRPRRRYDR